MGKLSKEAINRLKQVWKSNSINLFLTKIEWQSKEVAGQVESCYAYTSNPRAQVELPHSMVGTISVQGSTKGNDSNVTIWLGEMTDDLYDIYCDEGLVECVYDLDTGAIAYSDQAQPESSVSADQPTA